MIGLRAGIRTGLRTGLAIGIGADTLPTGDPIASVTKDATSGIYVPSSLAEWNTFIAAKALSISAPSSLWLMQETSGNLADSIGALGLTAGGTPSYQQTIAGWSRKAVKFADSSVQRFVAPVGTGPSPATTSQAWLGIVSLPAAPAGTRTFIGLNESSGANCFRTQFLATGQVRAQLTATADSIGSFASSVRPFMPVYDRSGSRAIVYSDAEKITGSYISTVADGDKGYGSSLSPSAAILYGAMWSGSAAEALSDASMRALYLAMGFSVGW